MQNSASMIQGLHSCKIAQQMIEKIQCVRLRETLSNRLSIRQQVELRLSIRHHNDKYQGEHLTPG